MLSDVQQGLNDATNGFKQMMVALMVFSLIVSIAMVVIAVKTKA